MLCVVKKANQAISAGMTLSVNCKLFGAEDVLMATPQ